MIIERESVDWAAVFAIMRATEKHQVHWKLHYTEKKYPSWEAWREATIGAILNLNPSWKLCSVPDPLDEVPTWYGGLFKAWEMSYYRGQPTRTFSELTRFRIGKVEEMEFPQERAISEHPYVQQLIQSFPSPTTVVALRQADGRIIVVEGMHRCAAIAVAARDSKIRPLFETELFVAIGDIGDQPIPLLGHRT